MTFCKRRIAHLVISILAPVWLLFGLVALSTVPVAAQGSVQNDPAEPMQNKPNPKILPRPAGAIHRGAVDEKSMHELVERLVACGTRNSLSSWDDPKRGAGCGRDQIVIRLTDLANASGGKLQVVVDKFESTGPRTSNKPAHMENVYAILPGSDPTLSKTVFIISGHFDTRATDVMDPSLDAPGADDDASGVAVSMECARLLSRTGTGLFARRSSLRRSPARNRDCLAVPGCSNG
jgi:Peptidase family M28